MRYLVIVLALAQVGCGDSSINPAPPVASTSLERNDSELEPVVQTESVSEPVVQTESVSEAGLAVGPEPVVQPQTAPEPIQIEPLRPPLRLPAAVCAASTIAGSKQITSNESTGDELFHSYSTRQAFNADESRLVLTHSNTRVFDVVNGDARNPVSIPMSSEIMWSDSDPDILYGTRFSSVAGRPAQKLVAYNVETGQTTELYNSAHHGYSEQHGVTIGGFKGHVQQDRYAVLHVSRQDGTGRDQLISLDLSTTPATILGTLDTPPYMSWSGVSPDGNTIVVRSNSTTSLSAVYDRQFNSLHEVASPPQPFQLAHSDWVIMPDGRNVLVVATNLDQSVYEPLTDNWYSLGTTESSNGIRSLGHISGLASKRTAGLYLASDTARLGSGVENNDSYIIKLDTDLNIDWSINLGDISGGQVYAAQTKGTISPSGQYIIYNQPVDGVAQTFMMTLDNSNCEN